MVHTPGFMATVSGGFRGQARGEGGLQVAGVEAAQRRWGLGMPGVHGPSRPALRLLQQRQWELGWEGAWVWARDRRAVLPTLVGMDWPGSWETLHLVQVTGRCLAAGVCPSRGRGLPACKVQVLVRVGTATEDALSPLLPPHDREPALGVPGDGGRLPGPASHGAAPAPPGTLRCCSTAVQSLLSWA